MVTGVHPPEMPPTEVNRDFSALPFILLAEDSPDDAYFFQRALAKFGFKCNFKHVSDGEGVIAAVSDAAAGNSTMPDVIFLDLKMPVSNGFEVLDWMRSQSLANLPQVVVLSGSNQIADRERAHRLGASGYLVKPITSKDLAHHLRRSAD